jgi:hypothetical protein
LFLAKSNDFNMKGPAIFLAQFIGDEAPYNSLDGLCTWAANHGYEAIQIPTLDPRLIDLALAAESKTYCDELTGKIREHGLVISELSTHIQGQLVAVHPAYNVVYDLFAPTSVRGKWPQRPAIILDSLHRYLFRVHLHGLLCIHGHNVRRV